MARFHDSTGKPGPATWANGSHAKGEDDLPVTGVSWFEAAAYARFIGKRLPSIYHWRYAAPTKEAMHLVRFSNFRGHGPVADGKRTLRLHLPVRILVFESGHVIPINPTNAEISAWLDRYLGPVKQ